MATYKFMLKKGKTFADVLDDIEKAVLLYMSSKRELDEAGMRQLLEKDTEVRASYSRKIQREIDAMKARGFHPSCFSY